MEPKISIIVPIYNMERYLSRCLDSLISQSMKEIEIIAVNDGSTDSSQEILDKYNKKDPRIRVFNKKNAGVSLARNEGMKHSRGEYIGFVDPDDWIDKEMYDSLYKAAAKENADIVMCSYMREFGSHAKEKRFDLPERIGYYGKDVQSKIMRRLIGPLQEELANPELLDAWGTVWSKLYRADIIKKNKLEFIDLKEIGTNEDSLFNIRVLHHAQSFIFLNRPFYHYWRENSHSVTTSYKPDLINQWNCLYTRLASFIEENKLDEDFLVALNNRICLNTLGLGLNTISKGNQSSPYRKIKILKTILNDHQLKRSFKQFGLSPFPVVWRAFYFCAKSRSALGLYLMLVVIDYLRRKVR